jgi:hypothetical protein
VVAVVSLGLGRHTERAQRVLPPVVGQKITVRRDAQGQIWIEQGEDMILFDAPALPAVLAALREVCR